MNILKMSIKTEELKKIEKGYGKHVGKGLEFYICGDLLMKCLLCPECQAKKTQTIELCKKFEDEVKEKVEKLKEEFDNIDDYYEVDVMSFRDWCAEKIDKIFGDEE